jgi:D-serine deaminase-like pyridoxal phosphate-dependent protein
MTKDWHRIINVDDVPSPALLVYPDRVEENVRRMVAIAGHPRRLRPHMKTHKLPEVIKLQTDAGITQFKCATIAEAEMVAKCGVPDVLLAYQPLGPNVRRLIQLIKQHPRTRFSALVDDEAAARSLSKSFEAASLSIEVLLDLDTGMHRTGVEPGARAFELYQLINKLPGLRAGGLHAYDGHLSVADLAERTAKCDAAFEGVEGLKAQLECARMPVPRVVAGGTPTFPIHAKREDVECGPGTCVFWDAGYGMKLPDMDFLVAALVLTRVVSKPGANRLCLDLGHKAIAAENPHPRVRLLGLPDAKAVMHSEEHLVVETPRAGEFPVGAVFYGEPWHICPTVALHSQAVVVRANRAEARWQVVARERVLTV